MIDYGTRWEEVRKLREDLQILVPSLDTSTRAKAEESFALLKRRIERRLLDWHWIEAEMEMEP